MLAKFPLGTHERIMWRISLIAKALSQADSIVF